MARIVYSAIVESVNGSVAGTTFQKNSYGHTLKVKNRQRPSTSRLQVAATQRFSRAVKAWAELTEVQRRTWHYWARTFPQYAKGNKSSLLSGLDAFTKYNALRLLAASNLLTDPSFTVPDNDGGIPTVTSLAGVLTLDLNSDTADGDWLDIIFLSRPVRATQQSVSGKTRFIFQDDNANVASNDITSYYNGVFGNIPSAGDYLAMRFVQIGLNFPMVKAAYTDIITVN